MDMLTKCKTKIDVAAGKIVSAVPYPAGTFSPLSVELRWAEGKQLKDFLQHELSTVNDIHGTTGMIKHHIKLKDPSMLPIKQRYRFRNPRMQTVVNGEVDWMLNEGVIEPSKSPWSSPAMVVSKKDGRPRFCIDFRQLNQVTERDAYPLPFINAILEKLRCARYFSSLDLKDGY